MSLLIASRGAAEIAIEEGGGAGGALNHVVQDAPNAV
jgi:hypothetical protein